MYDGIHADLTGEIVSCAIEVHRHLGAGLLESVYESALCHELTLRGLRFTRQVVVALHYKGEVISAHRVTGLRVGLLLNFNNVVMKDGIRRLVL